MAYIVSARKYRPLTFEDVVGQEQITNTLKRAIESDHLAQAFLFCGPRGVGKTTCARILAKAVNTGKTEKLHEIEEDFSFNIFELDAASNNKVEDMHQLMAQVRIPPQTGKYKIYIIDEVHMLSASAFNAFLKTLEEPPPYAIFILATTEKHKILPTILSRCQIYDFRRISVPDIVLHLQGIAQQENITAADEALHIIAEKADGALRDALSIFDRLVSFAGNNLTYESAVRSLNVLDYDYFFKLVDLLAIEDISAAFLLLNEIIELGFEGDHFINGLSAHLRNLLVCKDERTLALLETSESLKIRYKNQSEIIPTSFIINALSLASDADVNYKQSQNKRLLVEMMLMKIALVAQVIDTSKWENNNPSAEKKSLVHIDTKPKSTENTVFLKNETQNAVIPNVEEEHFSQLEKEKTQHKENTPIEIPVFTKTTSSFGIDFDALEKEVEEELKQQEKMVVTEDHSCFVAVENDENEIPIKYEQFDEVWKKLLQHFEQNEQKNITDLLMEYIPQLEDNSVIISLDSEVEKAIIEAELPILKGFLKRHFTQLKEIILTISVNDKPKKYILSSKDKFDILVTKNPYLLELKNTLALDLEN